MIFFKKLRQDFFSGIQRKGSFAQNLAITFSGNAMAQVIGFAFTPFIARLYGPEAYGAFALFVSIVNNISPLSTFQFPSGYVVADTDEEFYRLLKITSYVLLVFTVALAVLIIPFGDAMLEYFKVIALKEYLFLIPIYIFLMGLDSQLVSWNTREKGFRKAAIAKLISTFTSKLFTLLFAVWAGPIAMGIILGNLVLYPINSIGLFSQKISDTFPRIWAKSPWEKLAKTWNKFKDYPLYVTPGLLISGLGMQLPVYLFSAFFNPASVGYFALAHGVISAPLSILINSANVVFLQKAAEVHQGTPHLLGNVVLKLYKQMLLISATPLIFIAFTSKWIFSWVFGQEWQTSGILAAFVALSALFIINGPLSSIFRIMNKQRLNFYMNLFCIALKTLALLPGLYLNDIILSVIGYSFVSWLCSCASVMIVFRMVSLDIKIVLRDMVLGVFIFSAAIFLYR